MDRRIRQSILFENAPLAHSSLQLSQTPAGASLPVVARES
jgi:hypothetical protein